MSSSNILTFVKLFVLSIVSGWTSALSSFSWSPMLAAMPAGEGYFMLHSSSGLFAALSGYASPVTILCIYGTLSFSFGLIRPFYALELFIGSHCHSVAVYVSFCIYLSATALVCICYCISPIDSGALQSFTIVALSFATPISLLDAIAAIYGRGSVLCRMCSNPICYLVFYGLFTHPYYPIRGSSCLY